MNEERMDAMSDFIAENSENCDDCEKISIGELMNNINKTFTHINAILATYDSGDVVINEVKKLFGRLYVELTNKDMEEGNKECPCKEECDF